MTVSPEIDQLAAEVRRRSAHLDPATRKQNRRTAETIAADLPGIPAEHVGAVLLRAAVLASHVFQANPGASARDVGNVLGAAGQRLYHQAPTMGGKEACPGDFAQHLGEGDEDA